MINTTTAVSTSGDGSQIPSFTSVSRGVWAAFLMLWMQMWAVSRGSGWCHVWLRGPERAGWSERRGVGWPRWESRAAFFWRSVRLSLAVTLPLACINHSRPAVPPFHPGSYVFDESCSLQGLMGNLCFIEGYVSPDYLCRGVSVWVGVDNQTCWLPAYIMLPLSSADVRKLIN